MAFARSSRLTVGAPAPDFRAQTAAGEAFSLAAQRGSKVWLAFFRYASCPLCNLRVAQIIGRHDEFAAQGVNVVAVFQSSADRVAEFVGRQAPPFTIICDPAERLYKLYRLEASLRGYAHPTNAVVLAQAATKGFHVSAKMDGTKTRHPADFLIDGEGRLQDVYYADKISAHIPLERVERFAS